MKCPSMSSHVEHGGKQLEAVFVEVVGILEGVASLDEIDHWRACCKSLVLYRLKYLSYFLLFTS